MKCRLWFLFYRFCTFSHLDDFGIINSAYLKKCRSRVDKDGYLMAMERSPIKDIEIKHILRNALTDKINDREMYMKEIDRSYYYEGYNIYRVEEL